MKLKLEILQIFSDGWLERITWDELFKLQLSEEDLFEFSSLSLF